MQLINNIRKMKLKEIGKWQKLNLDQKNGLKS